MKEFRKSFILVLICQLLLSSAVFAHGKSDIEDKVVDNKNSWQETFDLDSKKPGKYNIMVTATDQGGNVALEGPFNIYYDPKSDLPVCGITNPYPGMRVVSDLNIVGTCVDDDAVDHVMLVLDGDKDHPIKADGAEFWSYKLKTLDLEEGPHTIQVTGYDINGLEGKPVTLTWQLDRQQPLTQITSKEMGVLASGTVKFEGVVSDGNGIKTLEYSVDGGKYFGPVKINDKKQSSNFSISINTKDFPDGPAILWFRATDMAGSVGLYSFLYFIDNTKPDVKIVSPADNEIVNGKYTVAGYAKDTIGITDLSWSYGNQNGVIDLVPGNPYWAVNLDSTPTKEKSGKFTIRAVDRANNVVEVTKTINFNQEDDKPVVTPVEPVANQIYSGADALYVRGIAKDDDGVQSIEIKYDNKAPVVIETKGVYYAKLCEEGQITPGTHKIEIVAIDKNGVKGNPVTTVIESKGFPPAFANAKVGKTEFVNGMEIHPESNSVFTVDVSSPIGIKAIHTETKWGKSGIESNDVELKNLTSYSVSFPVVPNGQKGVLEYRVTATDTLDRTSTYNAIVYVTNTSEVKDDVPQIVLDGRFAEDGTVINSKEFPATAYLLGAKAAKVELVPATPFASAKLKGNQIIISAGDAIGGSSDVVIRVTTDKGKTINSTPVRFKQDTALPEITIEKADTKALVIAPEDESITVSGKAKCATGIGSIKYRVISFVTVMDAKTGVISGIKPAAYGDYETLSLSGSGSFKITLPVREFNKVTDEVTGEESEVVTDKLANGMHIVEVVAESSGGNVAANAIALQKIPEIPTINGKTAVAKAPVVLFADGVDAYAAAIYQGELEQNFAQYLRKDMKEGANPVDFATTAPDGKPVAGKYTVNKVPTLTANFATVNDEEYACGMPVVMATGAKATGTAKVFIDTGAAISSVSYEITGANVPGGDNKQAGALKPVKSVDVENRWVVDIPLGNLPSRVNNIAVTIKAGSLEKKITGAITVIRENDQTLVNDAEKIFNFPAADTTYDSQDGNYVLSNGSKYYYYANYQLPIDVTLDAPAPGLTISTEGRLITLSAEKDGVYKDVRIRVKDGIGDSHSSERVSFIANTSDPVITLSTPVEYQWVRNSVTLSGNATHALGIRKIEYSIDGGETWKSFSVKPSTNVSFSESLDLKSLEDGLLRINIRATDNSGHVSTVLTSCYKDTTPPAVSVVEPVTGDVVNGQNLIVFNAKDESSLVKAEYVAPSKFGGAKTKIELNPLTSTFVGTKECPIDDDMSFIFTDEAGNKTTISNWDFKIDNKSDLPVSEIHVPEEMQVITRDFTISGVIYDDDGESTIFYKIDNGTYKQLPEMGTSFAIPVPLSTLTDNEHTVTVYAVDINGVKGEETKRTFRVSLEEPQGAVLTPTIDTSVKGLVTITGNASDKNGIGKVQISLDNGNSFNDAIGTENWSYTFDSRAIPGGTSAVFLKVTDNYGIQGFYSSLINIDNDAPYMTLELPLDDSTTTGTLFLSGYTYDNVEVDQLYVTVRNLEKTGSVIKRDVKIDRIIAETIDMKDLPNGFYNIELTGKDRAGNVTNISRNIHLDKSKNAADVDILYPLNGESKQGLFSIYGQVEQEIQIESLTLVVDGKEVSTTVPTDSEFFRFDMGPTTIDAETKEPVYNIKAGTHKYWITAKLQNGKTVKSREQTVIYEPYGPWVTIDNFTYGDFATERPFITGRAGYALDPEEVAATKTKEASPEFKATVAAKKLVKIELSFDNGKTFEELSTSGTWKYRVENQDIAEGYHFCLVRATMANNESAINRIIFQVDNTKPTIKLIAPSIGGRYNQILDAQGLSHDDVNLKDVTVTLRKGDKSSYEVPSFIQGLYLDFHVGGSTLYDVGAGLTFFDDNVKLQGTFGQLTQEQYDAYLAIFGQPSEPLRYGGTHVIGLKILANVAQLPFSYFLGRDWEWLYSTFAIGAQFSWYDQTASGKTQTLSALLFQLEFPKVKFKKAKAFSSFAFYTEPSIWFIPTDIASEEKIESIKIKLAFGFRTNIF